jgi:hypothetical protein
MKRIRKTGEREAEEKKTTAPPQLAGALGFAVLSVF